MRRLLLTMVLTLSILPAVWGQETDPTEVLLDVVLTQTEIRNILGDGNDSWVLESKGAIPRPPQNAIGVSATYSQGNQVIRAVIYEFETQTRADEFVQLGIDSVLAQLSGDPADVIESFTDPETEEASVGVAVLLTFRDEGDNQLIYLRANPAAETAIVVLIRSNLNEGQIVKIGLNQLQKLIAIDK